MGGGAACRPAGTAGVAVSVKATRLAVRTSYPGFMYATASSRARPVEFSGAEWRQVLAVEGLRLEVVAGDRGCLHAVGPTGLRYEIYEDGGGSQLPLVQP